MDPRAELGVQGAEGGAVVGRELPVAQEDREGQF